MTIHTWKLSKPVDAIAFDCDGTLSQIEGIDELAKANGVEQEVKALTEQAMSHTGITAELYRTRLNLVRPTQNQIMELGNQYYKHVSPDAECVISALKSLDKTIYILSAGIKRAVSAFAHHLNVSASHIYAVELYFDEWGNYKDYDHHSPMTYQNGKLEVIEFLKKKHSRIIHVGDGMNDIDAAKAADRFIGYGGAYLRESVIKLCNFYITSKSLSPLLPLCLTSAEEERLNDSQKSLYQKGLDHIHKGSVILR